MSWFHPGKRKCLALSPFLLLIFAESLSNDFDVEDARESDEVPCEWFAGFVYVYRCEGTPELRRLRKVGMTVKTPMSRRTRSQSKNGEIYTPQSLGQMSVLEVYHRDLPIFLLSCAFHVIHLFNMT